MKRASERSVSRLHIFDILVGFKGKRWDSADISGMSNFKHQDLAVVPAPSLGLLHFSLFPLITGSSQWVLYQGCLCSTCCLFVGKSFFFDTTRTTIHRPIDFHHGHHGCPRLLQHWQANRLMNIELSLHVKDNCPSLQFLLDNVRQFVSSKHKRTAQSSSGSRQAPAQKVDEHPYCIQRVTKLQCSDTGLL